MSRHREWPLECKVYVGNLDSGAAKHDLEGVFSKYGQLRNVWVARNPPGFAFVEFEDPRDAEDSVRALDGSRICGTRVKVEMSTGRTRNSTVSRRPPPSRPLPYKRYRSRSPSPRRRYSSRSRSRSRSLDIPRRSKYSRSYSRSRSRERRSRSPDSRK